MIFQAGLLAFFRTILIIAGIYYALKFIMRFLFPLILKRVLKKQFSNYSDFNSTNSSKTDNFQKEKEVKKKRSDLGEYVDYEEVKENE